VGNAFRLGTFYLFADSHFFLAFALSRSLFVSLYGFPLRLLRLSGGDMFIASLVASLPWDTFGLSSLFCLIRSSSSLPHVPICLIFFAYASFRLRHSEFCDLFHLRCWLWKNVRFPLSSVGPVPPTYGPTFSIEGAGRVIVQKGKQFHFPS